MLSKKFVGIVVKLCGVKLRLSVDVSVVVSVGVVSTGGVSVVVSVGVVSTGGVWFATVPSSSIILL